MATIRSIANGQGGPWRRLVAAAIGLVLAGVVLVLAGVVLAGCAAPASSANQLTAPPMGWNSWNHFGCSVTEAEVKAAADAISSDGLLADGYRYVNVDDCWQASTRDSAGRLRADPKRFPGGIHALAAYVHAKGLKFGIYAAPGSLTCAERYQGYPGRLGSLGHVDQDARTFADWGVDYLKYDWCGADEDGVGHEQAFAAMRTALGATGRTIVLSIHDKPEQPIPAWRHWVSDLSRTTPDIQDDWASVISIAKATAKVSGATVSGFWKDPDMLEVGNGGMNADEQRSHFALWAELNAPLIIGCDLRSASAETLRILGARRVIEIDQDPLAASPTVVSSTGGELVLLRRLENGASALSITNLLDHGSTIRVPVSALDHGERIDAEDLWTGRHVGISGVVAVRLAAHATALFRVASRR